MRPPVRLVGMSLGSLKSCRFLRGKFRSLMLFRFKREEKPWQDRIAEGPGKASRLGENVGPEGLPAPEDVVQNRGTSFDFVQSSASRPEPVLNRL